MPLLVPSCILAVDKSLGLGGLFHGGFKAVMNVEFLKKEMVTHIVNTAKGLEYFGPKYLVRTCQMYITSSRQCQPRPHADLGMSWGLVHGVV